MAPQPKEEKLTPDEVQLAILKELKSLSSISWNLKRIADILETKLK